MKIVTSVFLLVCFCSSAPAQVAKSLADYKAEAEAAVSGTGVPESVELRREDAVLFVDIRDSAEVAKTGKIAGAVHIPRGMLEFYIDPASSLHDERFSTEKKIVFYCATGGRSLLAAKLAKDMGIRDASYLEGGFRAWSRARGKIDK